MQTAALILGILALAFLFLPLANVVLSPMLAVGALVMGLISSRAARANKEDALMGTAGYVSGIIALALSIAIIAACAAIVKSTDCCDWKQRKKAVLAEEEKLEELSEEIKEEMREEVRREVAQEMERARRDRIESWKQREPSMTDEEWRKKLEQRLDEWIEWMEAMPIARDLDEAPDRAVPPPPGPVKPPPPVDDDPTGKKAAKKPPAKLQPDVKYPFGDDLE